MEEIIKNLREIANQHSLDLNEKILDICKFLENIHLDCNYQKTLGKEFEEKIFSIIDEYDKKNLLHIESFLNDGIDYWRNGNRTNS